VPTPAATATPFPVPATTGESVVQHDGDTTTLPPVETGTPTIITVGSQPAAEHEVSDPVVVVPAPVATATPVPVGTPDPQAPPPEATATPEASPTPDPGPSAPEPTPVP
jgi:hypothetical protein